MKQIAMLCLILIAPFLRAQGDSAIRFETNLTWAQVGAKAEEEQRLIFLDLYTEWCGPCKRLEKEVFSRKAVGDAFNDRFVNCRMDAEKGEGIDLARRYRVTAYPSLIFTDAEGNLVYTVQGYQGAEELLIHAEMALSESKSGKPLGQWDLEYADRNTDRTWLAGYIAKRNLVRLDNNQLLEDYFGLQDSVEWMNPENLELVAGCSGLELSSPVLAMIADRFQEIPASEDTVHFFQSRLMGIFDGAINPPFLEAIRDKNTKLLEETVVPFYEALWPDSVRGMPWYQKQDGDKWRYIYCQQTGDVETLVPVAQRYLDAYYFDLDPAAFPRLDSLLFAQSKSTLAKQGMDPESEMIRFMLEHCVTDDHLNRLMGAAEAVLAHSENPDHLSKALVWARRANEIRDSNATRLLLEGLREKLEQTASGH
ncbi:MAG: thioredoxin family protein [Bacteroidales bacterium]